MAKKHEIELVAGETYVLRSALGAVSVQLTEDKDKARAGVMVKVVNGSGSCGAKLMTTGEPDAPIGGGSWDPDGEDEKVLSVFAACPGGSVALIRNVVEAALVGYIPIL